LKAFPQAFSRGGVLTPEVLTAFLLFMVSNGIGRGIRHILLDFWDQADDFGLDLSTDMPVSASALCQARRRLNADLFRDLLYALSSEACEEVGPPGNRRWRGRRVFAIDGAKINLRRSLDHVRTFGVPEGAHSPQALMSQLVDVCTRTPIDFEFSGFRGGEREHALRMLDSLDAGDLLVLDRGYPSHEILQACVAAGLDFLVRAPASNGFGVIDKFRKSGAVDTMAVIQPPSDGDSGWHDIEVRLTRVESPSGPAFYISSLDPEDVSVGDIAELYHMRWEIEEYFKLFTSEYIGQKQFRAMSAQGLMQEVGALTLFLAMSRLLAGAANEAIEGSDEFASQKGAVLTLARYITRILLEPDPERARAVVARAIGRVLMTRDRRRPNRSYVRRSFKPTPKWCATGRKGA
jgi:hypothetical protein